MAKTQAQKNAQKKAAKQAKLDAQAQGDNQAQGDEESTPSQPEAPPVAPPVAQQEPVDDGSVHFCARFKKYRCRGTQFDNFRAAVTDTKKIAQLKADPKYGTEFWICKGNENAA